MLTVSKDKTVPSKQTSQVWTVIAPFFQSPNAQWLDDLIAGEGLEMKKVTCRRGLRSWHDARGRMTGIGNWLGHMDQALRAYFTRSDGIVTSFPHLAMCAGLLKRIGPWKPRIVAHNYNLGGLYGGTRGAIARFAAKGIDVFVVHAPSEVTTYSDYLRQNPERFRFVPLQRSEPMVERAEDTENPYILAMGSAHRDYETLIEAVEDRGIQTIIITRPDIAKTLPKRRHVTVLSGLTQRNCLELLSRARLSVTPVANQKTAAGQITFINAMQLGVPVIATRCPGTDGYIENGHTGLLVPPSDATALQSAIYQLWDSEGARTALSRSAKAESRARFSDQAAAASLQSLIEELGRSPAHS